MKVGLAQINTTLGDLEGNSQKILEYLAFAKEQDCQMVLFPEMAITGYPPADLLTKKKFIKDQIRCLKDIAEKCDGITCILGYVDENPKPKGKPLLNSIAVLQNRKIAFKSHKILLPTYDVFDESRYFEPGSQISPFQIHGKLWGLTICEDIWGEEGFEESSFYQRKPTDEVMEENAQFLINVSASPFHLGKGKIRRKLLQMIAKRHQVPIFYVNSVGGNDSLVFDGGSMVVNQQGILCAQAGLFEEKLLVTEIQESGALSGPIQKWPQDDLDQAYQALVLGLRDYVEKCGFKKVILGLSGGIDSAVTAALAVEALGARNVWAVGLPSRYSSEASLKDSKDLAKNLQIRFDVIPIEKPFQSFLDLLKPSFENQPENVTEENLQARIRGNILMALSNKFGHLLLSTGNKSEMAVGYCTLYGDMNGGLAVISDVPKTMVFNLARLINRSKCVIPENIITKPPSAELRENQKDSDSLPDYPLLDLILKSYIEEEKSPEEIVKISAAPIELVHKIIRLVDLSEYKRRQAALSIRITSKAFGDGRRLPIAQKYRPLS